MPQSRDPPKADFHFSEPADVPSADDLRDYGDPIRGFGIAIAVVIPLWILIVLGVVFFVFPTHR